MDDTQPDLHGYRAVHRRIRRERGPASAFLCITCDRVAEHWAYDHRDPNEYEVEDRGRKLTISADVSHYWPMCIKCHCTFDKKPAKVCETCGSSDFGSGSRGGIRYPFCRPCRERQRGGSGGSGGSRGARLK